MSDTIGEMHPSDFFLEMSKLLPLAPQQNPIAEAIVREVKKRISNRVVLCMRLAGDEISVVMDDGTVVSHIMPKDAKKHPQFIDLLVELPEKWAQKGQDNDNDPVENPRQPGAPVHRVGAQEGIPA